MAASQGYRLRVAVLWIRIQRLTVKTCEDQKLGGYFRVADEHISINLLFSHEEDMKLLPIGHLL